MSLTPYFTITIQLIDYFEIVTYMHVPREFNWKTDEQSQVASGLKMSEELTHKLIFV